MNLNILEVLYIISLFLAIVAGKALFGWYAEVRKRNRYMEAQIRLLAQIAAHSGVALDKIAEIVAEAKLPEFENTK